MYQDQPKLARRWMVWLPLLFSVVLVAGILIGMRMQGSNPTVVVEPQEEVSTVLGQGKIEELIRYIEAKYVDEVDRNALIDQAIASVLEQLDPHSSYIPSEQLQEVNEQLEGNFEGIGVEFLILDDTIVVVSALSGGPSEAAGIRAGDRIVEVADSMIAGINLSSQDVVELLRGEKGTQVEVGVLRGKEKKVRYFTIIRDKIPMHSVDAAYMISDKAGYIKINRFSATTYEEFMKSVESLVKKHKVKDLIIDLRHNPGGYLQQATNILSQLFRDRDKLLVYTEGRTVHRSNYESTGRALFDIQDVVVLIDEGSASASEILAGAVQDHDRGLIVGRRSFGKGLVQEQYRLRDGSALRLTVARYYTPSGRSIQKPYTNREEYENDMTDRFESGELLFSDKTKLIDTTRFFTDSGRIVYGGGGVTPDIFVPLDTVFLNDYYLTLRQYVPEFVYVYVEQKGKSLSKQSLRDFARNVQISDKTYQDFLSYAVKEGHERNRKQDAVVAREIKRLIKARVAKQLYGDEGFYLVWNNDDAVIGKALEALRSSKPITSN